MGNSVKWFRGLLVVGFLMMAAFSGGFAMGSSGKASETAAPVSAGQTQTDPLEQYRTERQQLRSRQRASLNEIIYAENSDDETVRLAQRQLMTLMTAEAQETNLEGTLRARGFSGVLATVQGDSVNVLLRTDSLNQAQAAIIYDLVLRETGVTGGNVKIIPIN